MYLFSGTLTNRNEQTSPTHTTQMNLTDTVLKDSRHKNASCMKSNRKNRNNVIRDLWLGGKTLRKNNEMLTIDKDSFPDQSLARII